VTSRADEFDLAARDGWPEDLRLLLRKYPRETWFPQSARAGADLGDTARFWLARHDMFREIGLALGEATAGFRAGRIALAGYRAWFAPRLNFFLGELESHHRIEDEAYFPIFRAAEPRLLRGFDVLESDHDTLHARIERTIHAANAFLHAELTDDLRRTGDAYAQASEVLVQGLLRHLEDEEDLVVPLIMDRTERGLGL
jgi:hypothetical protein